MLCRAMYEYGSLLQEVFDERPSLPFTWKLFRRFKRIDEIFAAHGGVLDLESTPLREGMRERADRMASGGGIRELEPSEMEQLFGVMLAEVDSISHALRCDDQSARDSMFRTADQPMAPTTLPAAIASCSAQVKALCEQLPGSVQSATVGEVCRPRISDYRLYLIVRDAPCDARAGRTIPRDSCELLAGGALCGHIPSTYLRLRYPTVLDRHDVAMRAHWLVSCGATGRRMLFLDRHGVVLWGVDLRREIPATCRR